MATFAQLEDQKSQMLAQIDSWSSQRLAYRPTAGEWSVSEMLDHIVKTEVAIIAVTRKGLLNPHRIGLTDQARTRFLNSVFRSDRKVKVPASATVVLPDADIDLPSILTRWTATRADLADLLDHLAPDQRKPGVFHHPVGGWMNIPEVLNFFSIHLIHHTYQLTRLTQASHHLGPAITGQ